MCGIGGFYNATGAKTPIDQAMSLWCALEDRGHHASGFSLVSDINGVIVQKAAVPSSVFAGEVEAVLPSRGVRTMLFHTRWATQGSTENNRNNHPIDEHGVVLTHNGVLRNDDFVFSDLEVHRYAQVDSEAINAALSYASPQYLANKVEGPMSIAWFKRDNPDTVYLFTNGLNPLVIARTEGDNIVWASKMEYIEEAGFKIRSHFHATPYKLYTLSPSGTIKSKFISKKRRVADKGIKLGSWAFINTENTHSKPPRTQKKRGRGSRVARRRNTRAMGPRMSFKTKEGVDPVWLAPWVRDEGETSPEDWAWKPMEGWVRRDSV